MIYQKGTIMTDLQFRQTRFDAGANEARDVRAALATAGLNWTTTLEPVYLEDQNALGGIRPIDGVKAVVRSDNKACFGTVGGQFTPVHNDAALGWIQPLLDSGDARLISAGHVKGGARVYVQAQLTGSEADVTPGDTIFSSVNFATGHDGSLTVSAGYSSIRVVCQNTMAGMIASLAIKLRHTSKVHEALEAARLEFMRQREATKNGAETFRRFARKSMSDRNLARYIREVLSAGAGDDTSKVVRGVEDVFRAAHEAPGATPGTLWGGLNAVTYWATHERGRSEDGRMDSLLFGRGSELIERAVQVATVFADQLPDDHSRGRVAMASHATASAEFGALLGRPARISSEPTVIDSPAE